MTNEAKIDLPNIFGPRGDLIGLTEEQATRLTPEQHALYSKLHDAYSAVLVCDKRIHDTEAELRAASQALRDAEAAVATLPRPSRIDEVRRTLMAQTAGRI